MQYRDVRYALTFGLQVWFYATPVAYPSSLVQGAWRWLYASNPMVGLVDGVRWSLFGGPARLPTGLSGIRPPNHRDWFRLFPRAASDVSPIDLMDGKRAIEIEGLSKRYRLGTGFDRYVTLRDAIATTVRRRGDAYH